MAEGAPKCSAEYAPHSGQNIGASIEGDGGPGEKEPMPAAFTSEATDNPGSDQVSAHAAFNATRSRPAPSADPDNLTGSVESDNPTAAEGATKAY